MNTYRIQEYFANNSEMLETIVNEVNQLSSPLISKWHQQRIDTTVLNHIHPTMHQLLAPIQTTGQGNCLYNALSTTLCGSEKLSTPLRLLTAYALFKHQLPRCSSRTSSMSFCITGGTRDSTKH